MSNDKDIGEPIYSQDDKSERIGTAFKLEGVPQDAYYNNDEEEPLVVVEYEDHYTMWAVEGEVKEMDLAPNKNDVLLVVHEVEEDEQ